MFIQPGISIINNLMLILLLLLKSINIFNYIYALFFRIKLKMFQIIHCLKFIARNQIQTKFKLHYITKIPSLGQRSYAISKLNKLIFEYIILIRF